MHRYNHDSGTFIIDKNGDDITIYDNDYGGRLLMYVESRFAGNSYYICDGEIESLWFDNEDILDIANNVFELMKVDGNDDKIIKKLNKIVKYRDKLYSKVYDFVR